jgi:hypothetical protein
VCGHSSNTFGFLPSLVYSFSPVSQVTLDGAEKQTLSLKEANLLVIGGTKETDVSTGTTFGSRQRNMSIPPTQSTVNPLRHQKVSRVSHRHATGT